MKILFKIYQYRNGLGEDVFKAKRHLFWCFWSWVRVGDDVSGEFTEWENREELIRFLTRRAEYIRDQRVKKQRLRLKGDLTLIVIQDVSL